ncbi:transporter substrate-binding domain-containing protein [Parachitinimonas caeni]|uniref:Transporter substrate-binding domain-containing protein n=1 Tax=Parachitinimonas caeni TaxID=3031301 RepID=A0ABT7DY08_9NEIS|nr:transporter substrate-binding domain-containing protein [Parachitinimonas caeni]MDK2124954.1 transporter substrate-binding domain-containing protein [Parachitinimonas caeni]
MKRQILLSALLGLSLIGTAFADDLDDIKKRGVLVVGVTSDPPFAQLNTKTQSYTGYDVDFAIAIARQLGVKPVIKDITTADRIPKLQAKEVDILVAEMTKTAERAKLIDFSHGYFVTGQKFIVRKGKAMAIEDLTHAKIGTIAGSTSEKQLQQEMPAAKIKLYPEADNGFAALQKGEIDAFSTDEPILAALHNKMPNKAEYEIPNLAISLEVYGIGVRKGEKRLMDEVNKTIVGMEQTGEAAKIFERWFGPSSQIPLLRLFKINAK